MKTKSFNNECPECGCRVIHQEHSLDLMPRIFRLSEENAPTELLCCYCLRCGVMFNPLHEAFAVC